MKVYVKIGCIDSNRDAHETGTVADIDKKTDQKLWDLKLVENYDEKKHGKVPETSDAALKTANEALGVANDKIAALETANEALNGFVEEAINLPKGQKPKDYVKAE